MLDQVALAYGGFDSIAVTAGIFVPRDTTGHIPDDKWALTFGINVTGSYLVADEAAKTWKEQGLPGNLVLTTSANAVVAEERLRSPTTPRKAAANHLVRELAIELAPLVRVNGVAPATVVQGSAMFPRDRVIASLAKYNIPYTEDEATESLTRKARAVLRRPHADQEPDHAGRPGGGVLPARHATAEQDHRPGHHRGRRIARGVFAIGKSGGTKRIALCKPQLRVPRTCVGRCGYALRRPVPFYEGRSSLVVAALSTSGWFRVRTRGGT